MFSSAAVVVVLNVPEIHLSALFCITSRRCISLFCPFPLYHVTAPNVRTGRTVERYAVLICLTLMPLTVFPRIDKALTAVLTLGTFGHDLNMFVELEFGVEEDS